MQKYTFLIWCYYSKTTLKKKLREYVTKQVKNLYHFKKKLLRLLNNFISYIYNLDLIHAFINHSLTK
jgi:hypothetical protein